MLMVITVIPNLVTIDYWRPIRDPQWSTAKYWMSLVTTVTAFKTNYGLLQRIECYWRLLWAPDRSQWSTAGGGILMVILWHSSDVQWLKWIKYPSWWPNLWDWDIVGHYYGIFYNIFTILFQITRNMYISRQTIQDLRCICTFQLEAPISQHFICL